MEERLKLLEAQLVVLQNTVNKMDQVLGVVFQWLVLNKTFTDALTIQKPEAPKVDTLEVAK